MKHLSTMALQKAFERTKQLLNISPELLIHLTGHFVGEMDIGLNVNESLQIPMFVTWVMDLPDGSETGEYLAIDLGGTNLRVIRVTLLGDSKYTSVAEKFPIPSHMRTGTSNELFNFIAKTLHDFVNVQFPTPLTKKLPLGFTFSYAATQNAINNGVLKTWSKGFDINGVEGSDVIPLLQHALDKLNTPAEVIALINDTTGTLVASTYCEPETIMGCIFGTGVNGAYYERVEKIGKLNGKIPEDIIRNDSLMAINCEYGAFDNHWTMLPRTSYDVQIDLESPRPGEQLYEKMIAGYYLGEVVRLILLDYYSQDLIFFGQNVDKLLIPFAMDTSFPSQIEQHPVSFLEGLFENTFDIKTTEEERVIIHDICVLVGCRAARLSATAIAALVLKKGVIEGKCACDGSVFNKYPNFKERVMEALGEIFNWDVLKPPIQLTHAEDGSGVGAAIIACLTEKRMMLGKSIGMLPT